MFKKNLLTDNLNFISLQTTTQVNNLRSLINKIQQIPHFIIRGSQTKLKQRSQVNMEDFLFRLRDYFVTPHKRLLMSTLGILPCSIWPLPPTSQFRVIVLLKMSYKKNNVRNFLLNFRLRTSVVNEFCFRKARDLYFFVISAFRNSLTSFKG